MERVNKSYPTLTSKQESPPISTPGLNRSSMFTTPQAKRGKTPDPNNQHNDDENEKRERRKTVMDLKRRRPTLLPSPRKKSRGEIELETEAPLPVLTTLSVEEINRRYEEWMKIAADNGWEYDQFSKGLLYSEMVVSETGILLNGLAESSAQRTKALVEEFEDGSTEKIKKKALRSEQTLVKDLNSLNLKNFELDFAVDPLFKKTCADFDEGGARGLLLNHLTTQGDGRLIFDASDATMMNKDPNSSQEEAAGVERIPIGLQALRALLKSEHVEKQEISPGLAHFEFGAPLILDHNEEKEKDDSFASEGFPDLPYEHDDFFNEPAEINGDISFATFAQQAISNADGDVPFDYQDETALVPSGSRPEVALLTESDNVYSYFDSRFVKNWAGPEHWKLKPAAPIKPKDQTQSSEPKAKVEKSKFEINFSGLENDIDFMSLFSKGRELTNSKIHDRNQGTHLLPDDLHFTSKNFLSLFNKPTFSLKPKHFQIPGKEGHMAFADEANAEHAYDMDCFDGHFSNEYASDNQGELEEPNTVFGSALDNPDTMFDMNTTFFEKEIKNNNFGEQLVPALKRIQAVRINYMRTAKRVDVKLLKDNLWKKISPAQAENENVPVLGNLDDEPLAPPVEPEIEPQSFSNVVKGLSSLYPKKKFNDLSVPFCFICLLHLANEHNLEIQSSSDMDELLIKSESITELKPGQN
ncbi:hypothetical protein DSO57_1028172 [Entomophthora muscae]|uniref:Uncharacterized protein n=1 Tax=Entomophthora muscae TaxID=34485 RepID=A0ACC2UBW3_9FUNG|nr:hypothetical protein DSO57_1028172 [Entomophthora muscae]